MTTLSCTNQSDHRFPTLRTIANALRTHLLADPENDLHWVQVIGEDSLAPDVLRWGPDLAASLLNVTVADGFSEGMLLYVYAQRNRYEPDQVRAIFRVKLLCGMRRAFDAARQTKEFLDLAAFAALVK